MITVKQTTFLAYWSIVNRVLRYLGIDQATYREMIAANELSNNPDDMIYYITTRRAEQA
jgi:hypothetical protein